MKITDDRKENHNELSVLIGGLDKGMSGWGKAANGRSYAFWACKPEDVDKVTTWVRSRGDIKPIQRRSVAPKGNDSDHCHIYCVTATHPALQT